MSTTSSHKRTSHLAHNGAPARHESRRRTVSENDAYLYALRVAYLAYLLKPRPKRTQTAPPAARGSSNAPSARPTAPNRSSSSIHDLVKDFSLLRDSKSTRLPHGFPAALEKRLAGVMLGTEARAEYRDAAVKRSCAQALNAFMEAGFRRRVEKDRRAEDLVLIFYSNATKALAAGKLPGDDGWKLMVDRHVALFVRLLGLVLKEGEWAKDRPELAARLATLETKLLAHDQDLSVDGIGTAGGTDVGGTIEVLAPLSYQVKDMPLVQVVARIFGLRETQVQADIDRHISKWTEKAALQDLKTYQTLLNTGSRRALRSDDFDLEDAYLAWKKAEAPDLSQMMLAIIQADPQLAKATNVGAPPRPGSADKGPGLERVESGYSDVLRQGNGSAYVLDQPIDLNGLSSTAERKPSASSEDDENPFTFMPPDPRLFYRTILSYALSHDLHDENLVPSNANGSSFKLLSKDSSELLNELCLRWRIPYVSRLVLFLDVCQEKFLNNDVSIDTLDSAFDFFKQAPPDNKKDTGPAQSLLQDRSKWTLADFSLNQQILTSLHEALLRDLYSVAVRCYEPKPPSVGPILFVLDAHVLSDPSLPRSDEDLSGFRAQLREGFKERAQAAYDELAAKHLPDDAGTWEFFHVIELGRAVLALAERIQKRYRKNPEIMGANPLTALIGTVLPLFAEDARDIAARVLQLAKEREEEVPVEDGFDLYRELVEIRKIHLKALPGVEFAIPIEELLADFVWRWIRLTEESTPGWVENAVKQDEFKVRTQNPEDIPTEEERHSVSVIDVFSSFNQTIDRIATLNWDDDLSYARFMTALARVIGAGVARYCELLEQRFRREMDRPTPEQAASAQQTRQERWVRMARDAWSNREAVEPFQFFPTSFVKLNDVEFATRQLDRLEHEVNVDACVAVIAKHAPPLALRPRRHATYVFTIKIVEAEDLRACDINGLSDPYVVLGDEYQKRLAKTRIVHANLNPRWDESVDITTQGPLNIVATVWDWDQLGDHDCVGRTSIKLDPSHFSDFLPREYWLDLDTQGRLLLRVSMEGERDDIQFYFGKAFRTLKRTEREMTRTITDKVRLTCRLFVAHASLTSRAALRVHQPLPVPPSPKAPARQAHYHRDRVQLLQSYAAGGSSRRGPDRRRDGRRAEAALRLLRRQLRHHEPDADARRHAGRHDAPVEGGAGHHRGPGRAAAVRQALAAEAAHPARARRRVQVARPAVCLLPRRRRIHGRSRRRARRRPPLPGLL